MNNQEKLIQKYLRGKATTKEKDELLNFTLKSLNKIMGELKKYKKVEL